MCIIQSFVDSAVKDNKLLYRDAYKLTNMKGEINYLRLKVERLLNIVHKQVD